MGGGGGVGVGVGGMSTVQTLGRTGPATVGSFISSMRKMFLPPASYFLLWLAARMSRRRRGSSVLSTTWGAVFRWALVAAAEGADGGAAELVPKSQKL